MSAIQRAAVDLSDRILQSVAAGHDLTALGAQWDLLAHYVEIASQTGSLVPSSAKAAYIAADRILCIGSSLSAVAQNGEALIAGLMADLELLDTRNATSPPPARRSCRSSSHIRHTRDPSPPANTGGAVSTHDPRSLPLRRWFSTHLSFPYPTPDEKLALAAECKITKSKLDGDLTNWRRRSGWTDMMMTYGGGDREVMREMIDRLEGSGNSEEEDEGDEGAEGEAPEGLLEAVEGVRRYLAGEPAKVETSWIDELPMIAAAAAAAAKPKSRPKPEPKSKAQRVNDEPNCDLLTRSNLDSAPLFLPPRQTRAQVSRKRRSNSFSSCSSELSDPEDSPVQDVTYPFSSHPLPSPHTPPRPASGQASTLRHTQDVSPQDPDHRPATRQRMNHIPSISSISSGTTLVDLQDKGKRTVSGSSGYSTSTTTSTLVETDAEHGLKGAVGNVYAGGYADSTFTFTPSYASAYGLAPAQPEVPNLRKRQAETGLTGTLAKHSRLDAPPASIIPLIDASSGSIQPTTATPAAAPFAGPAAHFQLVPVDPSLVTMPFSIAHAMPHNHLTPSGAGPNSSIDRSASSSPSAASASEVGSTSEVETYVRPQYVYAPFYQPHPHLPIQSYAYPQGTPGIPAESQANVLLAEGMPTVYAMMPLYAPGPLPAGQVLVPAQNAGSGGGAIWSTTLPLPQPKPEWAPHPGDGAGQLTTFAIPNQHAFAPRFEGWAGQV